MAPKRKAAQDAATAKSEIVQEVLDQLQPTLAQAVQDAVKAALPQTNTQPDTFVPTQHDDSDDDLEVVFNKQPRTGEPDQPTSTTLGSMGLHVSPAVVAKIRQNKFVKLTDLLSNQGQDMALNVAPGGNILLTKVNKSVKIASFDQWVSAFLVFSSIYSEQYPDQSHGLFKYMSFIQELSKTYGIDAAVKYDDEFRRLKAQSPIDSCEWETLNQELYLLASAKAVQVGNLNKKHNFRTPKKSLPIFALPGWILQLLRIPRILCQAHLPIQT